MMIPSHPDKESLVKLVGLIFCLLTFHGLVFSEAAIPKRDSLRYADYIYNLSEFKTFGLSYGATNHPARASGANVPLYPALASLVATKPARDALACVLSHSARTDCSDSAMSCGPVASSLVVCDNYLTPFILLNYFLAGISLLLISLIAFRLFPKPIYLYGSCLFAFLSFDLTDHGQRLILTNLVVPLFLATQYLLLCYLKSPSKTLAALIGSLTGLLTLTRPEYLYLVPCLLIILGIVSKRKSAPDLASLTLGFILIVSPWAARNQAEFGSPLLVNGNYSHIVFSERLSLNEMSWSQWGVSFVYWFPDVGDQLAKRYFNQSARVFDNDNPEALVNQSARILANAGTDLSLGGFFLPAALHQPIKHLAVSLALSWRGVFIGQLWAVPAIIGFILLLKSDIRGGRWYLFFITLLPIYMLLLRSGVSLNVSRYNAPMLGLLSMGYVYLLQLLRGK